MQHNTTFLNPKSNAILEKVLRICVYNLISANIKDGHKPTVQKIKIIK
jgi:hypothetical protein